jgi:hypothetical protein
LVRTTATSKYFFSQTGTSEICPLLNKSSPLPSCLTKIGASGNSSLQPHCCFSCQLPTSDHTSDVSSDAPSTVSITITITVASASASARPRLLPHPKLILHQTTISSSLPPTPRPRPDGAKDITGDRWPRWLAPPRPQPALDARLARTFCEPAALPPLQPRL